MIKSNIWPEPILCEQCRVNNAEPGQRICYSCRHSADRPKNLQKALKELAESFRHMGRSMQASANAAMNTYYSRFRDGQALAYLACADKLEMTLDALEHPTREGWQTTVNGPGYVDKGVVARCPHCGSVFGGVDIIGKNCFVCNTATVVAVP